MQIGTGFGMGMIINPSRFATGGGGGGGGHTYWRLVLSTNYGDGNYTGINELEMRATAGGADQCSGGTASVSNANGGGSAANVFDNNTGSVWLANGADRWVQYQFASPVNVVEVALTMGSNLERCPKDCVLQYSDDGATFTTAFTFTVDAVLISSTRVFPQAAFATGYARAWRFNITSNGGDANFTYIQEMEFRATAGGADQTSPVASNGTGGSTGRAIGTSLDPWYAFDNSSGNDGGSPALHYTGFVFPSPVKVEEITITNLSTLGRSPAGYTFDWLDQDGTTWHTQKTGTLAFSSVPQTLTVAVI